MTRKELETRLRGLRDRRDDLQSDADAASSHGTEDAALAVLGRAPARREIDIRANEAELAKLDRDIAAHQKALDIIESEEAAKALVERKRKLDDLHARHRANYIETVKAVVKLADMIAEDRRLCNEVRDIEGGWVGSLSPSFPFGGWFNAVNRGFLKNVKWR